MFCKMANYSEKSCIYEGADKTNWTESKTIYDIFDFVGLFSVAQIP